MSFKSLVKSLFRSFGYEIKRLPKDQPKKTLTPFEIQKTLLSHQEVQTVIDVGANIGVTVAEYHRFFPHATIYCFEPFESCFNALRGFYERSDRVKPYKLAICDRTETRKFFLNRNNGTNSLLNVAAESREYVDANEMQNIGSTDVQTTTLDDFCADKHIESVQLLKMDIQGGELMALKGAAGLLEKQAIDLLYLEVLFVPLYEGQTYFCDLHKFLCQYRYSLYGLYDLNFGRNGILSWADAIFINSRVKETLNHYKAPK